MDGAVRAGMTALALCATGCVAGDRELEPDELDARDLLGLAPSVAAGWDADERAAARARLMDAWAEAWTEGGAIGEEAAWPDPARRAADATSGLGAVNRRRAQSGQGPVIAGAGEIAARRIRVRIASPLELGLDDARDPEAPAMIDAVGWRADEAAVLSRGVAWAANLAAASGHPSGAPLRLHAVRQAPFGAVYLGEDVGMLVNPVLLASIEPAGTPPAVIQQTATASTPERDAPLRSAADGNPYSFYGSVAECAAAQRLRCEACLPSSTCELTSRDAPDGNSECETLAGGDGAGYHLYCVNLSLAIATVAGCVNDEGPACPQDNGASNQLVRLEANRAFLDDATCGDALDSCLASIYGEPDDDFPSPPPDAGPTPDGGEPPPPPPPPPSRATPRSRAATRTATSRRNAIRPARRAATTRSPATPTATEARTAATAATETAATTATAAAEAEAAAATAAATTAAAMAAPAAAAATATATAAATAAAETAATAAAATAATATAAAAAGAAAATAASRAAIRAGLPSAGAAATATPCWRWPGR